MTTAHWSTGGRDAPRTTLVGRFSPQTQVRENDAVEVAIDERALHFFDPQSGLAIYDQPRATAE